MRQLFIVLALATATFAPSGSAEEAGPYKVVKTARVGGEGGWPNGGVSGGRVGDFQQQTVNSGGGGGMASGQRR